MRVRWLLVLAPQLAVADPAAKPDPSKAPTITIRPAEPTLVVPPPDVHDPQRLPGATRGTGIVIEPPADFKDARDYPLGMVIRPPDGHDDAIWISPGAIDESLRGFARRLQDALGELGKLFLQH